MNPWSKYFSDAELACRCGCNGGWEDMDAEFMESVVSIRERLGFPLIVTSAYRCPRHDIAVGGNGRGEHTQGLAMDIAIAYDRAFLLVEEAITHGIERLGLKQNGREDERFVHVGGGTLPDWPAPRIWTYESQPDS